MRTICIDPGHGGSNTGVVVAGLIEKEYTLYVAKKLRNALDGVGWPILTCMTRMHDDEVSLTRRGQHAKELGSDLVLSLHVNNSPNPRASGLLVFHQKGDRGSAEIAKRIARCAPVHLKHKRPVWAATPNDWTRRAFNVLSRYDCPAVLIEMGHASNNSDKDVLLSPSVQDSIVAACLCGVSRFLELHSGYAVAC